jgi:hypothetical protein
VPPTPDRRRASCRDVAFPKSPVNAQLRAAALKIDGFHCTHRENLAFLEGVRCFSGDPVRTYLPDRGERVAWAPGAAGLCALGLKNEQILHIALSELRITGGLQPSQPRAAIRCDVRFLSAHAGDSRPEQIGINAAWTRLESAKRRPFDTTPKLRLALLPKAAADDSPPARESCADDTRTHE